MNKPKVSIITVCYNSAKSINDTILSVLSQNYSNIEYIIIDGDSQDGTQEIVRSFGAGISKFISEEDNGIYDAMNKGIKISSGEIVGILNSDDVYTTKFAIDRVVDEFSKKNVDSIYADLFFFSPKKPGKILRLYSSRNFKIKHFERGIMPGHATFFVKKDCYDKYGYYDTSFSITADFDLLLRFLYIKKIEYSYIPEILVKMRIGGVSTKSLKNKWRMYNELLAIFKKNNVKTNHLKLASKYLTKIYQYVRMPKR